MRRDVFIEKGIICSGPKSTAGGLILLKPQFSRVHIRGVGDCVCGGKDIVKYREDIRMSFIVNLVFMTTVCDDSEIFVVTEYHANRLIAVHGNGSGPWIWTNSPIEDSACNIFGVCPIGNG